MVTKTRDRLIEVARQLFARKGIENTTMNDIAEASDKGRRTIYTYFRNKREIYNAVVEHESEQLVSHLRQVAESKLSPVEKLREYLQVRLKVVDEARARRTDTVTLRSFFSRDVRRLEKIRNLALSKEADIFAGVINEGVQAGVFDENQAQRVLSVEAILCQGIDYNKIHSTSEATPDEMHNQMIDFIVEGLLKS